MTNRGFKMTEIFTLSPYRKLAGYVISGQDTNAIQGYQQVNLAFVSSNAFREDRKQRRRLKQQTTSNFDNNKPVSHIFIGHRVVQFSLFRLNRLLASVERFTQFLQLPNTASIRPDKKQR